MRSSKLVQLLQQLPEDQRKQFGRYVASPYVNPVPRLGKLLEVLEQHLLRYKSRELTEQAAFALVLPDQEFDQNRFRKDCSALVKLLLDFLAWEQFQQAGHLKAQFLLQSLNQAGLDQYLPHYHAQALADVEASDGRAAEIHAAKVQLGIERYTYDLRQPGRDSAIDLDALLDHQEAAHAIRKMELCYMQLNHYLVTGKGKLRDEAAFLQSIAQQLDHLPPKTQMHYHLYRCTLDPEAEADYAAFKKLLGNVALDLESAEEMYTAALNYCARRSNAGHSQYLRENFEIYCAMLDRNLLGTAGRLMAAHFKNIVVLASKLREFDWARQFVAQHQPQLQGEFNRNAHNFSLGYIAFMEGQFEKAESCLYRVLDDYEDIYYGVDARMTLLRIHYETANTIGLDSLADSFRMFIKRNTQLSGHRKANLQAFIRYIRRLAHIPPFDAAAFQKLRQDILTGRKVTHTEWLLSKVDRHLPQ
jgi:hypothetical protein